MKKKLSAVFIALSFCLLCLSNDYRFTHLTSANGLSQSEVYTFLEDRNGFMWIGTLDGLNRFDGYSFETFNTDKKNPNSITNNTIRSLAEDQYGRIWIGTDNGLNYYDQYKEQIFNVKINASNDKLPIWSILFYDNNILIGTRSGLWKGSINSSELNQNGNNFYRIDQIWKNYDPNARVQKLLHCKRGGIWVLTGSGVSRIKFHNDNLKPIIIEELPIDNIDRLVDIEEDSNGLVWILSYIQGLVLYNPQNKSVIKINQENSILKNFSNKISNITIDRDNKIWLGTDDKGLICFEYDYDKREIFNLNVYQNKSNKPLGINSNLIYSSYATRSDQLWFGTIGSGINILDKGILKIDNYRIESENDQLANPNFIRAVIIDKQNRIIASTYSNGLFLIDRETKKHYKLGLGNETIFHICEYQNNQYLLCTSYGISLIEINGNSMRIIDTYQEFSLPTFYILPYQKDIYWCATIKGLYRIRVKNGKILSDGYYNKSTEIALSHNNCRVLNYLEKSNELIVGTEGGGVNFIKLNNEGIPVKNVIYKSTDSSNSISNSYIRSIFIDHAKNIWIGTFEGLNKAIYQVKTGTYIFKNYTKNDGLPNNMIQIITEDKQNNLWLGTNDGLSKFLPDSNIFMNYYTEDGLQSNEFSEHTVYKTENGEIVIGGINGINSFFPEDIKNSSVKPRTLITDFFLNNQKIKPGQIIGKKIPLSKSVVYTNKITLSPENKNIGFKFSAMIYPNSSKIKYAYILEGFDKEWKYTDALNRNIHYTNLRHGNYTFKVKATNPDGLWEQNPVSLQIEIETPFYLTWYAYICYIIIFISVFLYFTQYTVISLTTKRNLILEKLHNEKQHKLDELRTNFFINISHDLRTPLTLISEPLNEVIEGKRITNSDKDLLLLAKRNVKRLTFLVEQLLDIRKAEMSLLLPKLQNENLIEFTRNEMLHFNYALNKKKLELKFEYTEDPLWWSFDPSMISKVYFNIVSNAIKYTPNTGQITIRIEKVLVKSTTNSDENYVKVQISDSGIGIRKEQEKLIFERFYQDSSHNKQGYGIGLSHTKDIIDAHKGFIEAESSKDAGTIIRFFLPEIKKASNYYETNKISSEDILSDPDIGTYTKIEKPTNNNYKNILIVEDNPDMLNYLNIQLNNYYNVLLAKDGTEGLSIAREKMPDLIISDVMMPGIDGIEFCREIKTNINSSHIPVILLTAKTDLKTKYEGIETGADDFIPKPFEMKYLVLRINNLLQSRENLRKLFQQSNKIEPAEITVTSIDKKFLSTLMDAIEERMSDESFSISSLESLVGMSHTSFYRKIKTLTGQSAKELLLSCRMKKAYQILSENSGVRVSEVAYSVGFSNHAYFTRVFKEVYGYPPSDIKHV